LPNILRWNVLTIPNASMHLVCYVLKISVFLCEVLGHVWTFQRLLHFGLQKLSLLILLNDGHFIFHVLLLHKDVVIFFIKHHILVVIVHHLIYLFILLVKHVIQSFILILFVLMRLHCNLFFFLHWVHLLAMLFQENSQLFIDLILTQSFQPFGSPLVPLSFFLQPFSIS
jgi:hypothetical protein